MQDRLSSESCARLLRAVADPERLKIIQCLQGGPKNVSELSGLLSEELANVSHHLGVLRNCGLVRDEKQGKYVVYSLSPTYFGPGTAPHVLDLGCCRLDLTGSE